ncbi:hypothetical protein BJX63DRAFT_389855 [Aspergillus granulosus]|uniref:Uncharacterized protein n=1 Tax=Aspergillus granulosus TaxID=176169 RepID=A0ABR4HJ92_9EURO
MIMMTGYGDMVVVLIALIITIIHIKSALESVQRCRYESRALWSGPLGWHTLRTA